MAKKSAKEEIEALVDALPDDEKKKLSALSEQGQGVYIVRNIVPKLSDDQAAEYLAEQSKGADLGGKGSPPHEEVAFATGLEESEFLADYLARSSVTDKSGLSHKYVEKMGVAADRFARKLKKTTNVSALAERAAKKRKEKKK